MAVSRPVSFSKRRYDIRMSAAEDVARLHNRLNACSFTLNQILLEIEDPEDQEQRVELLLAVEDVLNTVYGIRNKASEYVWGELDKLQHPSAQDY